MALVEQELVGGECSYYACMPSKALLRPGELLAEIERVPGVREMVSGELDARIVLERRDEVIHDRDDSAQLPWLEKRGIELIRGRGGARRRADRDRGPRHAAAPGAPSWSPPGPRLPYRRSTGSPRHGLGPTARRPPRARCPDRLLVLGGGVVGVEMAQAWSSLGASVTLVEAADRILAAEEPFASEQVAAGLERGGVEIRTGVKATAASRGDGGQVTLELEDGDETARRRAPGRGRPQAAHGRARARDRGSRTAGGYLEVDDQLRVGGSEWLYAIGDVNGRALLTHMGKYQARVAADAILGKDVAATCDKTGSPRVVFTEPQVAAVGLTLAEAEEAGVDARAVGRRDGGERRRELHRPQRAGDLADRRRRAIAT